MREITTADLQLMLDQVHLIHDLTLNIGKRVHPFEYWIIDVGPVTVIHPSLAAFTKQPFINHSIHGKNDWQGFLESRLDGYSKRQVEEATMNKISESCQAEFDNLEVLRELTHEAAVPVLEEAIKRSSIPSTFHPAGNLTPTNVINDISSLHQDIGDSINLGSIQWTRL